MQYNWINVAGLVHHAIQVSSHVGPMPCRTPYITYQVGLHWSTMSALILRHNHVGPLIGYQVEPTRL